MIINFENVKCTEDLITYSKLYNSVLTDQAYLNNMPLTFKKDDRALLVEDKTLDYFKKIKEIEDWLNLRFTDFHNLFEATTFHQIETLVNLKNRIPSDYMCEIRDLKVELGNDLNDLEEISNMILSDQPAKPQLYFRTSIDFSLLGSNFSLSSIAFIKNYEADRIFSKVDTKKSFLTLKKPTNSKASIRFISFKDKKDLDSFCEEYPTNDDVAYFFNSK